MAVAFENSFLFFNESTGLKDVAAKGSAKEGASHTPDDGQDDNLSDFDREDSFRLETNVQHGASDISKSEISKASRHQRVAGGKAASGKAVSHELDAEDQIIFDMKRQGFSDKQISDRLKREGLTDYQPASIGSRYKRIQQKITNVNDELLDEELSDWHDGEDNHLLQAYCKADKRIDQEIENVRKKRFQYVSLEINRAIERPRFSAKACEARYTSIMTGTALPPPELDDDPVARQEQTDQRKAEYQKMKRMDQERKAKELEEYKLYGSATAQAKLAARLLRDQKDAERDAIRAGKVQASKRLKTARNAVTQRRKKVINMYRKEIAEKIRRRDLDQQMLSALQKKYYVEAKRKASRAQKVREEAQRKAVETAAQAADDTADETSWFTTAKGRTQNAWKDVRDLDESSLDPREMMTRLELQDLVAMRGMPRIPIRDAKQTIVQRLRISDRTATDAQLKSWLKDRHLFIDGSKPQMIWRLAEYDAMNASSWKPSNIAVVKQGRDAVDMYVEGLDG